MYILRDNFFGSLLEKFGVLESIENCMGWEIRF